MAAAPGSVCAWRAREGCSERTRGVGPLGSRVPPPAAAGTPHPTPPRPPSAARPRAAPRRRSADPDTALVMADGGATERREERLPAWAGDMMAQLASQRSELRQARLELAGNREVRGGAGHGMRPAVCRLCERCRRPAAPHRHAAVPCPACRSCARRGSGQSFSAPSTRPRKGNAPRRRAAWQRRRPSTARCSRRCGRVAGSGGDTGVALRCCGVASQCTQYPGQRQVLDASPQSNQLPAASLGNPGPSPAAARHDGRAQGGHRHRQHAAGAGGGKHGRGGGAASAPARRAAAAARRSDRLQVYNVQCTLSNKHLNCRVRVEGA